MPLGDGVGRCLGRSGSTDMHVVIDEFDGRDYKRSPEWREHPQACVH